MRAKISGAYRRWATQAAALLLAAGCTGEPSGGAPPQGPDLSNDPGPERLACPGPSAAHTRLERLTHRQYGNTVRDLVGQTLAVQAVLAPDPSSSRFDNESHLLVVGGPLSRDYRRVAEQVATEVAKDADRAHRLAGCSDASRACVETFVSSFGARAFRRPLTPQEHTAFVTVFETGQADGPFAAGVGLVLEAMLQTPEFIYRVSLNDQPGPEGYARPGTWELASQLSYALWNSMPDAELFAAAADGTLSNAEVVRHHIQRMLGDPRARDVVHDFHAQYMESRTIRELQRDRKVYPNFTTGIVPAMKREVELFAAAAVLDENLAFKDFMTAPFTIANAPLAKLYGVAAPINIDAEGFGRVNLDPAQRGGPLTQIGFLASRAHSDASSPILRGKFVLKHVLGQELPPPPANVIVTLPAAEPGMTTRELITRVTSAPACAGCHNAINPLGFAFETFDAVGQWRSSDAGKPINAQGELSVESSVLQFDGPRELIAALADSPEATAAYTQSWISYLLARQTTDDMRCLAQDLVKPAGEKPLTIKEMLAAAIASGSFLNRLSNESEGANP